MSEVSVAPQFSMAAEAPASKKSLKKKRPTPLAVRMSEEQKQRLKREAAGGSVNGYVLEKLFGESATTLRRRYRKPPTVDHAALGRVLGALGQSRLAPNMNQIAHALNRQEIDVSPALVVQLTTACGDIRAMRQILMKALGVTSE